MGQSRVISFDSPGTNDLASTLNDLYDGTKEMILENHPWTFSLSRARLQPDTASPAFYYDYQYDLPSDFNYLISLGEDDSERDEYRLEGNKILAFLTPLDIRYCKTISDDELMSAGVAEIIALYLAVMCSMAATGNDSNLRNQLFGQLREHYRHTVTRDARQQKKAQVESPGYLRDRFDRLTSNLPYYHKGLR